MTDALTARSPSEQPLVLMEGISKAFAGTEVLRGVDFDLRRGEVHAGERILLLSVASGLEVGVVLFTMDELEAAYGHAH